MTDQETWQRLLLTLPDTVFFDIMRNYLGKIRTPFHKPDLIKRLTAFILNAETQNRIIKCIDKRDARVLTALNFLDEPEPKQLFNLLTETEDPFTLHHHLMNLEYRLLILTDTSGTTPRIRSNPLLRERFRQEVFDLSTLFPSKPLETPVHHIPWLQDTLVTALLSFLGKDPEILKADGQMKKKPETELRQLFPQLFDKTNLGKKIDLLMISLEHCGLIRKKGVNVNVLWDRQSYYTGMSRMDRLCEIWCNILPGLLGSNRNTIEAFLIFIDILPSDRLFSRNALEKIMTAVLLKLNSLSPAPKTFIDVCIALEILYETDENFSRTDSLFFPENENDSDPAFVIQQNLHITVKPEISFEKVLAIARGADLLRYDIYSEYEFTKASFFRFLQTADPGRSLIEILETPQMRIPSPAATLMCEWEREFNKVKLYDGIIVTVDESLRHLVEHTAQIQKLIQAVIAPGVYLFSRDDYSGWREALAEAGIEHLPILSQPESHQENDNMVQNKETFHPSTIRLDFTKSTPSRTGVNRLQDALKQSLNDLILPEEQREELTARIEKRFILFPDQLQADLGQVSKRNEAKGIDYMGKVRLIEQALASARDILEVIERSSTGEPKKYILSPVRLDRTDDHLILTGKKLPEGDAIELQVRKLSLVRKLESVLFNP